MRRRRLYACTHSETLPVVLDLSSYCIASATPSAACPPAAVAASHPAVRPETRLFFRGSLPTVNNNTHIDLHTRSLTSLFRFYRPALRHVRPPFAVVGLVVVVLLSP